MKTYIFKHIKSFEYALFSFLLVSFIASPAALAANGFTWTPASGLPNNSHCYLPGSSSTGQYLVCAVYNGDVYTSADYGSTWTDQTSLGTSNWFGGAVSANGQDIVVSDASGGGYLHMTTNGGATWSIVNAAGLNSWSGVAMSSNGQYIVATNSDDTVYVSTNSGATWSTTTVNGSLNLYSVSMSENGQYIYVADDSGSGNIYESANYGATWTVSDSSQIGPWLSVETVASGQYAVATNLSANVFITNDYGSTWNAIPPGPANSYDSAVISSNGQDIIAASTVSGSSSPFLYESFDGGQTWNGDEFNSDGWFEIVASNDLSRVLIENSVGQYTLGYNPALFIPAPTNQDSSSNPGSSSNSNSNTVASVKAPDTGSGQVENSYYIYYFASGFIILALGYVTLNQRKRRQITLDISK